MQILPEKLCREHNVLPVKVDSRMVWLAMANPLDQEASSALAGRRAAR